jgi:hypothetical protein
VVVTEVLVGYFSNPVKEDVMDMACDRFGEKRSAYRILVGKC